MSTHRPYVPPDGSPWPPPARKSTADRLAHHMAMLDRFPDVDRIDSEWGPLTPWTRSEFHTDRARRMTYYLGTHRPNWLAFSPVPLFISASTLAQWKSTGDQWPTRKAGRFGCGMWAFDSGAFTAWDRRNRNWRNHPWHLPVDEFGGMVVRFMEEIGVPPQFAAIQDLPCEPGVRAATGLTVRQHQEIKVENYLYLIENFPMVPWAPVLQGWEEEEYLEDAEMYAAAGVDLSKVGTVGLGSVCRRGPAEPIVKIVRAVQAHAERTHGEPLRLHGFGVNIAALRIIGDQLASADSMAWSRAARPFEEGKPGIRLAECDRLGSHDGWCNNCVRWALRWRESVMDALRTDRPLPEGFDLLEWAAQYAPTAPRRRSPRRTAPAPVTVSGQFDLFEWGALALPS